MRPLVLITLGLLSNAFFPAYSSPIFNCDVEHIRQLGSTGELVVSDWEDRQTMSGLSFTFNPRTGAYKTRSGVDWTFDVFETGNDKNSLKATRVKKGPASVVLHSLSILTWDQLQFMLSSHNEVRSGRCKLEIGSD